MMVDESGKSVGVKGCKSSALATTCFSCKGFITYFRKIKQCISKESKADLLLFLGLRCCMFRGTSFGASQGGRVSGLLFDFALNVVIVPGRIMLGGEIVGFPVVVTECKFRELRAHFTTIN